MTQYLCEKLFPLFDALLVSLNFSPRTSTLEENPLVQSLQKAQASIDAELEEAHREAAEKAKREAIAKARRDVMADPSSLVKISVGERLPDEEVPGIAAHNRAVCDQIITVAGLTPSDSRCMFLRQARGSWPKIPRIIRACACLFLGYRSYRK